MPKSRSKVKQFSGESADRRTDGWKDRRYQTYYLPCFAVDYKKKEDVCLQVCNFLIDRKNLLNVRQDDLYKGKWMIARLFLKGILSNVWGKKSWPLFTVRHHSQVYNAASQCWTVPINNRLWWMVTSCVCGIISYSLKIRASFLSKRVKTKHCYMTQDKCIKIGIMSNSLQQMSDMNMYIVNKTNPYHIYFPGFC